MKKIFIFLFCSLLMMFTTLTIVNAEILRKGFHKVTDTNISPNTTFTVRNTSFNERIYMLIFDDKATPLQGIRLKPQSTKYNIVFLKPGYKIVLIGDGEIEISPNISIT